MGIQAPEEIKADVKETPAAAPAPAAKENTPSPAAAPAGLSPEAQKIKDEYEAKIKERDAKISDLSTSISTIEERQRQLDAQNHSKQTDDEMETELQEIEDLRLSDPTAAVKRTAELFKKNRASAANMAQSAVSQQATIEKLKAGVKSSNPDFDDDVVDYVMERADALARTGKFKTADEAIQAATTLVKSKFDGYASKKNAVPPLPPSAQVEGGGNTPPTPAPKDTPPLSPTEELNERKASQFKKII